MHQVSKSFLFFFIAYLITFTPFAQATRVSARSGGGGGDAGDITDVGDCTTGACFNGTQGTLMTFNDASGDGTISYNGTMSFDRADLTGVTAEQVLQSFNNVSIGLADGTTLANNRVFQFLAPTINGIAGGAAEQATNATTTYISGAPSGSNITFLNPKALWVDAGTSQFDGVAIFGSTITTPLAGNLCVETTAGGDLTVAAAACGSGNGDITTVGDCTTGDCFATGGTGTTLTTTGTSFTLADTTAGSETLVVDLDGIANEILLGTTSGANILDIENFTLRVANLTATGGVVDFSNETIQTSGSVLANLVEANSMEISAEDPTFTFNEDTGGQADFTVRNTDGTFQITNSTSGSVGFSVGPTGAITVGANAVGNSVALSVATGNTITGLIAGANEFTLQANNLNFNNGVTDTGFGWDVSGELDLIVGGTDELRLTADNLAFEAGATDPVFNFGTSNELALTTGNFDIRQDNGQIQMGAGSDVFIQYTGTVWDFDVALATTEIVFNNSSADTDFRIETNGITNTFFLDAGEDDVELGGHVETTGTVPTLSACGTTPAIDAASTDMAGKITVGAGVVTTCTLTFNSTWDNAPACTAMNESAILFARATSTPTTLVIDIAAGSINGNVISYQCLGFE